MLDAVGFTGAGRKELAANYADYANGAHQELFFAPHSRNPRNSRLIQNLELISAWPRTIDSQRDPRRPHFDRHKADWPAVGSIWPLPATRGCTRHHNPEHRRRTLPATAATIRALHLSPRQNHQSGSWHEEPDPQESHIARVPPRGTPVSGRRSV